MNEIGFLRVPKTLIPSLQLELLYSVDKHLHNIVKACELRALFCCDPQITYNVSWLFTSANYSS